MNYQRKSYELFHEQSKQLSDYNKSINTPETYGNEVYRLLKNAGYADAKQMCLDNSNYIFNAFLMGDSCSDVKFYIIDRTRN
jgi:hypothetical protein